MSDKEMNTTEKMYLSEEVDVQVEVDHSPDANRLTDAEFSDVFNHKNKDVDENENPVSDPIPEPDLVPAPPASYNRKPDKVYPSKLRENYLAKQRKPVIKINM